MTWDYFHLYIRCSLQGHFKGPRASAPARCPVPSPGPGWPLTVTVFRTAVCKPVPCQSPRSCCTAAGETSAHFRAQASLQPLPYLWPTTWPWGGHLTSLDLSFPLCKVGTRLHTLLPQKVAGGSQMRERLGVAQMLLKHLLCPPSWGLGSVEETNASQTSPRLGSADRQRQGVTDVQVSGSARQVRDAGPFMRHGGRVQGALPRRGTQPVWQAESLRISHARRLNVGFILFRYGEAGRSGADRH